MQCCPGHYGPAVLCFTCPAGTYQDKTGQTLCTLCRAGRYTIHVRAMMAQQPWLEWSANWTAHATRPPCAGPWYAGVLLPQHIIEHDGAASTTSCAGGLWSWPDSNEYRSAAGTMLEQITPAPHPNRTSLQTLFGSLRFTEPSPRRAARIPML